MVICEVTGPSVVCSVVGPVVACEVVAGGAVSSPGSP